MFQSILCRVKNMYDWIVFSADMINGHYMLSGAWLVVSGDGLNIGLHFCGMTTIKSISLQYTISRLICSDKTSSSPLLVYVVPMF